MEPPAERYDRQLRLPQIGEPGQRKIERAGVLVVGAGGLGSAALPLLAGAGLGLILVCDPDLVSVSNLPRQTLYTTSEVTRLKAQAAAARLRALKPQVEVVALPGLFADSDIRGADVVLDCTDNPEARYQINRAALAAGKPVVWGAVGGWYGRVSVSTPFTEQETCGACWRCIFGAPEDQPPAQRDPAVFGPLCAMTGAAQAAEALKLITGAGAPLIGRMATLDLLTGSSQVIPVRRDPHCPDCHVARSSAP
jgi:molybdopterin/thiamine biosynthesis adenylyltransferase